PNDLSSRHESQRTAWISNLRQWAVPPQHDALEFMLMSPDTPTPSILPYTTLFRSLGVLPSCPSSGTYSPGATVAAPPTCSESTAAAPHHLPSSVSSVYKPEATASGFFVFPGSVRSASGVTRLVRFRTTDNHR